MGVGIIGGEFGGCEGEGDVGVGIIGGGFGAVRGKGMWGWGLKVGSGTVRVKEMCRGGNWRWV